MVLQSACRWRSTDNMPSSVPLVIQCVSTRSCSHCLQFNAVLLSTVACAALGVWQMMQRKPAIYMVDFVAQRPDDRYQPCTLHNQAWLDHMTACIFSNMSVSSAAGNFGTTAADQHLRMLISYHSCVEMAVLYPVLQLETQSPRLRDVCREQQTVYQRGS